VHAAGTLVGPYRILAPLGAGGMGEVYLAHDPRLERNVALKLLARSLGANDENRARFARETRAIARLDHPNIVTLHEVGDDQGQPYLVMQYVAGRSLGEFARGRQLTFDTVLDLGGQLCAGLQAAHEQGVVHRDVKPSNILIDSHLRARLVDFGLARIAGEAQLTSAGALPGTIGYVSPEVVLGEEADARSDLFSLGVVLYELLTGHLPFAAASVPAYVYAVVHEQPEPLASCPEGLPPGLEAVIEKALAKDRALRYATAADFGADLEHLRRPAGGVGRGARQRPSIAVLPFEDMSSGHDQEYLCDGIAEELIQVLTRIEGLRVVARTSAFAFKGSRADVREIGRKLGVQTLLAGSVRKAGNRVRIGVQLVDVRDGSHLWAETYDRQLEDIFAVQDEVCLSAAERLKVALLEEERTRVVRRPTQDATAYTLYLKGRFLFYQRNEASMRKCVEYLTQAIERDPRFALAHAGLAEAYESLGSWRLLPRDAAYGEARRAAQSAVKLDDQLAEGHEALATIRMFCDWDWAGASQEYERALAINPACVEAHHMYAHWHEAMGRFDRALAEMNAALELEPVAPALHSCFAEILFHARRYDETVRQCGLTLEMAPGFAGVYGWAGMAHVLAGRASAGLEALREGLERRPGDPRLEALQGTAYALVGRKDEARASVKRLDALAVQKYVDPYFRAWPHVALGDPDAAFTRLGQAYDDHSQWIYLLRVDPLLDGLRSDPRLEDLTARMRLPA
jgi:TolB-like protein/Tfp pilus assembly protein PilF